MGREGDAKGEDKGNEVWKGRESGQGMGYCMCVCVNIGVYMYGYSIKAYIIKVCM